MEAKKFPQILRNDWQVQVWTDKHTCYFAYYKRPPVYNGKHTIHSSYEAALLDAMKQAGISE